MAASVLKQERQYCIRIIRMVPVSMVSIKVVNEHPRDPGEPEDENDTGVASAATRPKLTQPPLYKVVLHNDDYTPMDFVVDVLCTFFSLTVEQATQIMLKVHTEGKAVCGVFTRDIAETKTQQVNEYSRKYQQPLLCDIEVDR